MSWDRSGSWFVVVPDTQDGLAAVHAMDFANARTVSHPSGRPWLLGNWSDDEMLVVHEGDTAVAVIGCSSLDEQTLRMQARRLDKLDDAQTLARDTHGSFHLLVAQAGEQRLQGGFSGVRRIFYSDVGDVTLAASRSDVLATLTSAAPNYDQLATKLLHPFPPYPLADIPPWESVSVVPADSYLHVSRAGMAKPVRWWVPPEATLPLRDGAALLREELTASVAARVDSVSAISADLSGGLDSTPLSCLAAIAAPEKLTVFTTRSEDPGSDDDEWVQRALPGIGEVSRRTAQAGTLPLPYDGPLVAGDLNDEPVPAVTARARLRATATNLVDVQPGYHLTGFGGDEVLQGLPTYLRPLLTSSPSEAVRHLRGYRALRRWPLGQAVRGLLDRRPYHRWLHAQAGRIGDTPRLENPFLGWNASPFHLPAWVPGPVVERVVQRCRDTAATATPLSEDAGQHAALEQVRCGAQNFRLIQQMMAVAGLRIAAPFFDDRVVEACLSVRLHERTDPWRYKPLIVEAMRGIVPEAVLTRRTKAITWNDEHRGLRRNRQPLLALCDDSMLAAQGLIDPMRLRSVFAGPVPADLWPSALSQTLGCETWLRDHEHALVPAGATE